MPTANFVEQVLFYEDVENASNPQRKHVDWKRTASGLPFEQVYSERFLLAPGATKTLESTMGVVDLSTTPVNLVAGVAQPTWYRFVGAFPSSPWAAALAVSGQPLVLTVQVDGTMLVTGAGLASLAGVTPGDWVYLAGSGYGDTGSVSAVNQGFWKVTAVGVGLTLVRIYPTDTSATETVTTGSVNDVQLLADATRPRWLFVRGAAGYAGLYTVVGAAIGWLAIVPSTTFVSATAVTFDRLLAAPKFIAYARVESDEPVTVKVGDVATAINEVSLQPITGYAPAWYESFSFATSLAVQNKGGSVAATINLIYALSHQPS